MVRKLCYFGGRRFALVSSSLKKVSQEVFLWSLVELELKLEQDLKPDSEEEELESCSASDKQKLA